MQECNCPNWRMPLLKSIFEIVICKTDLTWIAKAVNWSPVHVQLDAGLVVVNDVPDELGEGRLHLEPEPAELFDVDPSILEDDLAANFFVIRAAQGQENLVAVAGNEALERMSAHDEADGSLHGVQELFGSWSRVVAPCQRDRRCSAIFFGQSGVGEAGQSIENVHPAVKRKYVDADDTLRYRN